MIRRPPRSTPLYSSAASDVYKRQVSAGGAIGAIVSLGTQDAVSGFGQVNKGMGAILLVIFGLVQAVVALTAFVIGSGFVATPRSVGDVAGYGGTSAAVTQAGSGQFIP